ncbi:MAG: hypothetical protein IPJ65_00355 [Archangiaceae bacterium]|nr:hypothetical protein [Archangiaceae bacterium]
MILASASGCLTTGSVQRAETLGKGGFEIGVEPGVFGLAVTNSSAGAGSTFLPAFNISGRFGIADRVDIGARIGSGLLEFNGKFMITDPANTSFALSLAPSVAGFILGGSSSGGGSALAGLLNFALPVLIGLRFGEHELVFGPRLNNVVIFAGGTGGSGSIYVFLPGVSAGFAIRATDFFEIMPEVSLAYPVAASAAVSNGSGLNSAVAGLGNGLVLNFGVGFKFGKLKRADSAPPAPPPPGPDEMAPPPVPPPTNDAAPPPPPPPPPAS